MEDLLEISELVSGYFSRGDNFDKDFYERIISIVTKRDGTEEYVRNFYYMTEDEMNNPELSKYNTGLAAILSSGLYDSVDKALVLYPNAIVYNAYTASKSIEFPTEEEKYMFENLFKLQTLLHELEHVKQHKMVDEGDNSLEGRLLSAIKSIKKPRTISTYEYDPTERLAEIRSYETMTKLLSILPFDLDSTQKYFSQNLKEIMEKGYEEDISSTEKFFTLLDAQDKFNQLLGDSAPSNIRVSLKNAFNSLSTNYRLRRDTERVELGLPISRNGLDEVISSKV